MKRAMGIRASAILVVLLLISSLAVAQGYRSRDSRQKLVRSKSSGRLYTPQIKAYSDSLIIEGRISLIEDGHLIIKTARGNRIQLEMDDNTAMFESGEEVSFATMADISLSASDLKTLDAVEVVIERAGQRTIARIITRIAKADASVARR